VNTLQSYLKKNISGDSLIQAAPKEGLKFIIVLPAYLETRLEESLVSLLNTDPPGSPVEVLIVINWPEDSSPDIIQKSYDILHSAKEWINQNYSEHITFHPIEAGFIPGKKAGVGYARRLGMDEAIRRFVIARQADGIIVSFDADTLCDSNYITSIDAHFKKFPGIDGCSVYFEHPLGGSEFAPRIYKAITQYELHMRYYLNSVRFSGFPNAFYTVGSAFAVRAQSYCRQGGMNVRQAGEDFYFLQKFFDLGNFSDLKETRVCPSPRPSLRVPFGTGKAIDQLINIEEPLKSYNPVTFDILKELFERVPEFYEELSLTGKTDFSSIHPCMQQYLNDNRSKDELLNIYSNSGSLPSFVKRFYRYFNMFRILKFAKHARTVFPDLPVSECASALLQKSGMKKAETLSEKEMLLEYRRRDRLTND
jgi:hypothetical protein